MKLIPEQQINLYCYDNIMKYLTSIIDNNTFPNKVIFYGQKGIGKSTIAYHIINYIFSKNEDNNYDLNNFRINEENRSFNLIINKSHPNFFHISLKDEKKNIEISQIREMILFCNKSSFDNRNKIILIDNAEYLNKNSTNALLKIVEEPNEKIIFFFINNSNKKILDTLKSRCIKFNINLPENEKIYVLNKLIDQTFYQSLNTTFRNYYLTTGDYVNLYNFFKENKLDLNITIDDFIKFIIKNKSYKNSLYIKEHLSLFFELLFSSKNIKFHKFNYYYYFLKQIYDANKYNLDIESIILEFQLKYKYE
tara:strand:- start:1823 stop:2746 length:924 start_codon:yes stop_codon:yes gene_type:complete